MRCNSSVERPATSSITESPWGEQRCAAFHVALFGIEDQATVTVAAVRHQRESDRH